MNHRASQPVAFLVHFALVALLLAAGCATAGPRAAAPAPRRAHGPLPVPFIAQRPGYCGPAALAMVAGYHGHHVTQDEIAAEVYQPALQGTLTTELADAARRRGLWTRQYHGSVADLRQKLAAGLPLIVLGRLGARDHYFVVLGIDNFRATVTVHSDTRPHLELSAEEFGRWWDRAGHWTLLVCPAAAARWELSADEHNDLGVFYERAGHPDQAAAHYRAATRLRPAESAFQMNLGNALGQQGRWREAAAAFDRARQLEPENADALNNLAGACLELGEDLDHAAELCRRAVALRPAHRSYYFDTLGSVLLKQNKPREAVIAFAAALAATTDHQPALRAAIRDHLRAARLADR